MLNMYLDDLAQRITTYANQRGDKRWREALEAAARIAEHRYSGYGSALPVKIADDIRALLNQPADKVDG